MITVPKYGVLLSFLAALGIISVVILYTTQALLAPPEHDRMGGDSLAPATYSIRICRAPCDPASDSTLIVRGKVILLAKPMPERRLPRYINEDYYRPYRNACFVLDRIKGFGKDTTLSEDLTYAGIFPVGVVGWGSDSTHKVEFSLYWSPDARYWIRAIIRDGVLEGHGQSQGFPYTDLPIDSVAGRSIGPPNVEGCIRAALGRRF